MNASLPVVAVVATLLGTPAAVWHQRTDLRIAVTRTVDLGAPGALDAVAKTNPGHYRRIIRILDGAAEIDCEEMPAKLYVKYGTLGNCTTPYTLLTSFPAKRHLAFTIDETAYVVNVAMRDNASRMVPAVEP